MSLNHDRPCEFGSRIKIDFDATIVGADGFAEAATALPKWSFRRPAAKRARPA
jgi:hypothetical protein